MAVETDSFSRSQLHTLFIIARIINFIKGVETGKSFMTLDDLLVRAKGKGHRTETGASVLERLLKEKCFYAATGKGLEPVTHFDFPLFEQVWKRVGTVGTLSGGTVNLTEGRTMDVLGRSGSHALGT